jgi:glutamate-5-semialdehyde dehydrogenase
MVEVPVRIYVTNLAKKAKEAARPLALLSTPMKNKALCAMADRLLEEQEAILAANQQDVDTVGINMKREEIKKAITRVQMTAETIQKMADGLRRIAQLPDPVGDVTHMWVRPNGMQVSRMRVPIGVIGIVSDMGPLVLTEMAGLCVKAGNAVLIRGGPEWIQSAPLVAAIMREEGEKVGLPASAIGYVERGEKDAALEILRQVGYVDAVIPCGGLGLRKTVVEQSRIPVLCQDFGISHVYVDAEADLPLAQNIVINSKVQEPSSANSVDTLLVHHSISRPLLSALLLRLLEEFRVDVLGCVKTVALARIEPISGHKGVLEAKEEDWKTQFLSPTLAVKIIMNVDEAINHIMAQGVCHTAAIVTKDYANAMRFTREVDASAVLVNASTRFNDGVELGFGGHLGVDTGRVHSKGPIGLEQLTCLKVVVLGTNHLRHPHPTPVPYEDAIMLRRPLS